MIIEQRRAERKAKKRVENKAENKPAAEKGKLRKGFSLRDVFLSLRYWPSLLLSNLRFSLTLRIALHFAGELLRTTTLILLALTIAFASAQVPDISSAMDELTKELPKEGRTFTARQLEALLPERAYYLEQPIEKNLPGFFEKVQLTFSEFFFERHPKLMIYRDAPQGGLVAVFDMEQVMKTYTVLFWTLLCCDLYRAVFFLRKRSRLNKPVIKPIQDMANAAAALSANNLSDRISIEGTKNELKDLATVINLMLDRIERSYNSQKQFVSDASHELRTPIAVIQGYVSLLERWGKTDTAVLNEGITAIAQETTSMKELVERLLFLARHDKQTLMLEMELFDPTEVMSSVYRDAQMLSTAHTFELGVRKGMMIKGDKGMIKQLMRILVDNAIKYTPAGGKIKLDMRLEKGFCVLTVTDTGAGIAEDELKRIFDRFYRSDKARKAQTSGHGLGLSIARIIVAAHRGKLNVRSKVGVGTSFSVKLPISTEQRA